MDRYLYVSSDDSTEYFSDNQAYKFKVHLHHPLTLRGFWKVGLVEFHAEAQAKVRPSQKKDQALYIFTDLCKGSILWGSEQPLLRRLESNSKSGWDFTFENAIYLPVTKKELVEFEVVIKTEDGTFPSFLKSPLHLTLHLKPYPFYSDYESV